MKQPVAICFFSVFEQYLKDLQIEALYLEFALINSNFCSIRCEQSEGKLFSYKYSVESEIPH